MLLKSRHRCDNKSLLLFLACFLFVSSIISEVVSTSSSSVEEEDANFSAENNRNPRDAITLKYGQKLRKKPRKLEVELELPAREEYSHQEEQAVPPSSTLPPIKTKHGRVPSKIMVRTHKTTTPEPQQYDDHQTHHQPQELTTESSIPTWKLYYQNPYISRKPSIPPKKYVFNTSKKVVSTPSVNTRRVPTTSTTTTPHYTFPPYDHSTSTYAPDETTIDPTYYRHSVPEFGVGESRTLSRTLETPPPPPPPTQKVVTTQRTRGKIHSSIKTVSGVRRTTTTTTTTEPPPQVYEENTTTYPSSSPNNVESGVEDQKYSNPSISSGEQQDFETTIYYSPSTTTSTSPPTSSTTRRQQPKTKVTTTTTTHRVVTTRPPTQTTVEPTLLREYISHSQPSNVGGIPLKVTTKTFKPIYRVVTEEDAADENERKPELELIRSTSATAPEENETNSTTSTASDNLTPTNLTTTPPEQQAEQLNPSQPTTPAFLKNKVHYIITVIDPPKQGLNSSSNPNATSLSVGENVEEFVEEADEDIFPFSDLLTTPPSTATNRQQGHILAPSSSQESEPFSQLLQRFQSLNIPAPDFINDAINSPSSSSKPSLPQEGRDEQIFHFSSSRPYQQIGSKSVAGSGSSRSNYIVEDNTPFNKVQQQQQNYNSFKLQSVPLRTVVTYQPEPTSRLQDTGALFTDRSVAFYTHLEDGKITKQLLRAPGANNNQNNNDYSTVLPQFLSQFQSPTVREQRSSNIITNDELRTFPAQSYYLEQQVEPKQHQSGVSRIRTQVVTVDDGGEEYDQDNLRTIPFTVDLVPQ